MGIGPSGPPCAGPLLRLDQFWRPLRQGFTRQPENSKRAHLTVPTLQNTTEIPREDPQKRQKERNGSGREGQRARNFGPPPPLHPSSPQFVAPRSKAHDTHQTQKWIGQNTFLAKMGQIRMAKTGLVKVGLFRPRRLGPELWPRIGWGAENFALFSPSPATIVVHVW